MGQADHDSGDCSRRALEIPGDGIAAALRAARAQSATHVETSTFHGKSVTRRAPQDLRLPSMVYAAVGALEHVGTENTDQAMQELRSVPGVVGVLAYRGSNSEGLPACDGGVAVVARGYWLARQHLARLMDQCGAKPGTLPADACPAEPGGQASPLAKLTASSSACTVQFYNGRLRIWVSCANPRLFQDAAARIAGLAPETIDLRLIGTCDSVHGMAALVPAIAIARELGSSPVQLIVAYELELRSLGAASLGEVRARREAQLRVVARAA